MGISEFDPTVRDRRPWNAERKVGAKRALKPRQVWAIRFFLDQHRRLRDRALFDLAIDSKLRGCDVVKVRIGDLVLGAQVRTRAIVVQAKTGKPVQFELMPDARASLLAWLERRGGTLDDFVFRVAWITPARLARASTPGLWMSGWKALGYAARSTERTRSGELRLLLSTRLQATCGQFKSCSVTRRSRTRCVIWAWTWRMR
jgi:integrase